MLNEESKFQNSDSAPPTQNLTRHSQLFMQIGFYFGFAVLMIFLNMGIQNFHAHIVVPFIQSQWGTISWIQTLYLSTSPYNMPELIGSATAVVITYIVKFFLDKFIVFRKGFGSLQETNLQFWTYFLFAIITTAENLGIQFLLGILTHWDLNIRIGIALTLGYITKFLLDRKYCFKVDEPTKNSSNSKSEKK